MKLIYVSITLVTLFPCMIFLYFLRSNLPYNLPQNNIFKYLRESKSLGEYKALSESSTLNFVSDNNNDTHSLVSSISEDDSDDSEKFSLKTPHIDSLLDSQTKKDLENLYTEDYVNISNDTLGASSSCGDTFITSHGEYRKDIP